MERTRHTRNCSFNLVLRRHVIVDPPQPGDTFERNHLGDLRADLNIQVRIPKFLAISWIRMKLWWRR